MTRAERMIGMISLGLVNGLVVGGTLAAAHRGLWWGAALALVFATAIAYALACRGPERVR